MSFILAFIVAGILLGLFEALQFALEVSWAGPGTAFAALHVALLGTLVGAAVGGAFAALRGAVRTLLGLETLIPVAVATIYFVAIAVPMLQMLLGGDLANPLLLALVSSLACAGAGLIAALLGALTMRLEDHGAPWRFVPHLVLAVGMVGFYFWFRNEVALAGARLLRPGLILFHLGIFAVAGLSRWGGAVNGWFRERYRWAVTLGLVVVLNVAMLFTPQWEAGYRLALERRAPLANRVLGLLTPATDFDGDGVPAGPTDQ